jgi:hypothetical protein
MLRRKSGELSIPTVVAEGCRLPLQERNAGGVVLARVLCLVSDWRGLLSGAKEILRSGGVLFHEWGNGGLGEAWVEVREKARSLFEQAGVPRPFHPGARSEHEVESYLLEIGFRMRKRIDAGPGPMMTLNDFLGKIEASELSYVWNVPKTVQNTCLPLLRQWCEGKFDLLEPMPIPAEHHWVVYENGD